MKKEFSVLEHYKYDSFSCIGGSCKYSCCKQWNIVVDKETYKKYQISSFFTKEMMDKFFTKMENGDIKFRLNHNNTCPLQNENRFCDIHSNLGESFLCKTCRVYPRTMNLVDNSIEKGLSMSCPAAIEKLILDNKKIEFNQSTQFITEKYININIKANTKTDDYMCYFWDIRIFTTELLQNRKLSIEERLVILGLFYRKLDTVVKEGSIEKIPIIIELYKSQLNENGFNGISDGAKTNYAKVSILNQLIIKEHENIDYRELTNQVIKIMEFDNSDKLIENYDLFVKSKYNKFLLEKEYILENYLVNLAFTNAIPFEEKGKVFDKYLELAVLYSLVKLYLLGTDEEEITEERVIKVITLLSRVINHNPTYIKNVVNYINSISDSGMNKLAILVTLLK